MVSSTHRSILLATYYNVHTKLSMFDYTKIKENWDDRTHIQTLHNAIVFLGPVWLMELEKLIPAEVWKNQKSNDDKFRGKCLFQFVSVILGPDFAICCNEGRRLTCFPEMGLG